jgi:hypothetical protein
MMFRGGEGDSKMNSIRQSPDIDFVQPLPILFLCRYRRGGRECSYKESRRIMQKGEGVGW